MGNLVKSQEEIELMKKSGEITAQALKKILENVRPGVTCSFLDHVAQEEIEKRGASSSFKAVEDYQWTICTTINEQVVHGIPIDRKLENGDILGIDIGALYKGYHSDMAQTVGVGEITDQKKRFINFGMETLKQAIQQAKVGSRIGDISALIQERVENAQYSVVKSLTGHGIGRELHEDPIIPGFGKRGMGPKILENMVLAIEIIYAEGSGKIKVEPDNWTISTKDGSLGGLFEQTVAIKKDGPIVLTPFL